MSECVLIQSEVGRGLVAGLVTLAGLGFPGSRGARPGLARRRRRRGRAAAVTRFKFGVNRSNLLSDCSLTWSQVGRGLVAGLVGSHVRDRGPGVGSEVTVKRCHGIERLQNCVCVVREIFWQRLEFWSRLFLVRKFHDRLERNWA